MERSGEFHLVESGKSWEKKVWVEVVDFIKHSFNPNIDLSQRIKDEVTNTERYLGHGGAGKVFDLGNNVCIKMMRNRHADPNRELYNLGNSVSVEAEIQNRLRDFEVQGVFVPHIVGYYAGKESAAIVMERLEAVNLQEIINKKAELPENFNLDAFFDGLYAYVEEMHDKFKIVHNDLEARNVMVDQKTGQARVIDFGRSIVLTDKGNENERLKDKDFEKIDTIFSKLETFLKTKAA